MTNTLASLTLTWISISSSVDVEDVPFNVGKSFEIVENIDMSY